jgi:hypothetical protein
MNDENEQFNKANENRAEDLLHNEQLNIKKIINEQQDIDIKLTHLLKKILAEYDNLNIKYDHLKELLEKKADKSLVDDLYIKLERK